MPKHKLLTKFFSSGMQAGAIWVLGGLFFYIISVNLSKESFGLISWMSAICFFITTVLGFGLEQVVVRRISASRSDWAATAFFVHSLLGFILAFLVMLGLSAVFKSNALYQILPWFFVAQGLVYIGIPLKQYLNAKENFTPYGIIAVVSNMAKIIIAYILIKTRALQISDVILILIVTSAFELVCLLIYLLIKTQFNFRLHVKAYLKLLKEASPQYLSVVFDMSLSRMDWILLGMLTTNAVLADYSFAYRIFELARLPMLIIGPVILPGLSRLMSSESKLDTEHRQQINLFNSAEMFFAMMIPLVLNILWIPLIDLATHGKYGASNAQQFLLLSLCIPFQLFINLLWSISFAAKKYRQAATITVCSAVVNIALNSILIPIFQGNGAAIAFLITTLLQCALYYRLVYKHIMVIDLKPLLFFMIMAVVIYAGLQFLQINFMIKVVLAVTLFLGVSVLAKQIGQKHIQNFKQFLA